MAANLTAFIDDSKDSTQQQYFIAAAVVGRKSDWNVFNNEWAKTLSRAPSIAYFHSIEWRGLKKQFLKFRQDGEATSSAHAAANIKRDSLLHVITSSLRAISVSIDVQGWHRVKADHPRPEVIEENPYKTVLQELVYAIAKDARAGEHKVNFVCDSDNRAAIYQQVYSNFRKKNPETAKKITRSLTFADDELTYGLQAADLVAHTINRVHQQYGLKLRDAPPPNELVGLMSNVHVWDYDYGMAMLDSQSTSL